MRHKCLILISLFASILILIPSVFASHFISSSSPSISTCNLTTVVIAGTFVLSAGGDADAVYAETINGSSIGSGDLMDTGTFSNYPFDPFVVAGYPYTFRAILSVVSRSTGATLEQYALSGTCNAANTGTVTFREIVSVVALGSDEAPFNDGRINNWDMGNPVVVYGHDGDTGRGLVVYSTEGVLLLEVTADQIAAIAVCPNENTLIASAGAVALYRLTSCQYQLNAPSLDGTKTYVLIFNDLYENTGYTSHEE